MNNAEEVWKPVRGFEGVYDVSNTGKLRSYKKHGKLIETPHVISLKNSRKDYIRFVCKLGGKTKTVLMHRLVYEHFIGEIPQGMHVHHINGDKQDNRIDNLELVTPSEHVAKTYSKNSRIYDGMNQYNKYTRPKTILMYTTNGDYIASFPNAKAAEQITGVCGRNILQVAGKTEYKQGMTRKQAGGYVWKFQEDVLNEGCLHRDGK